MHGSPGKPQPTFSEGEVRLLLSDLIDITCLASRTSEFELA